MNEMKVYIVDDYGKLILIPNYFVPRKDDHIVASGHEYIVDFVVVDYDDCIIKVWSTLNDILDGNG